MTYHKILIINTLLILMLFQLVTFAQEENYEPILKEGNVWTSGCSFGFWEPYTTYSIKKFKAKGDTTILGVNYHKIYTQSGTLTFIDSLAEYYCAAREEGPKLYFRPPNSDQDLLNLDLSAEVGEFYTIYSGYDLQEVEVKEVGETDDGRKFVSLTRLNCYTEDYWYHAWIEGIGSTRGFYDGLFGCEYFDTCYDVLLCLEEEENDITYQLGVDCNYVYEFSGYFDYIKDTAICLGQSIYYHPEGDGGLGPYSISAIPQTNEDTIITNANTYNPYINLQPSETTSYIIYIKDSAGNLDSTEITINVSPEPIIKPEITFDFPPFECEVDSLLLYIEGDYANIWWTNYAGLVYNLESEFTTIYGTDSTLLITEAQTYYVIVENNSGCREHDYISFNNTIKTVPIPQIQCSSNIHCVGDTFKVWTSEPYISYSWGIGQTTTGETTDTIEFVMEEGFQFIGGWVDVIDERGCEGRNSYGFSVSIDELPELPSISFDGAKLIATSTSPNLQWYLDNEPIEGATDSIHYPFKSGIYTVEAKNENETCSVFSDEFYFESSGVNPEFDLKLNLEGAYNNETNKMNITLLESNLLPLKQPYNKAPFSYNGNEQVSSYQEFPNNTVDWVLIEVGFLADDASFVISDRKAGLLLSDGKIVNAINFKNIRFENLKENFDYNIKIKHRNHLDITSSYGIQTNTNMEYDFQKQSTSVLGDSQLIQLTDGKYGMITGNYLNDQVIQTTDYDFWFDSQTNQAVYHNADGNLDGKVDLLDYELWLQNRAKLGIK